MQEQRPATVPPQNCPHCRRSVRKKLCEGNPGSHVYCWVCELRLHISSEKKSRRLGGCPRKKSVRIVSP